MALWTSTVPSTSSPTTSATRAACTGSAATSPRYKVGGHESVFEIWATDAELREIRSELERLMLQDKDRLHIPGLDQRMQPRCKGGP